MRAVARQSGLATAIAAIMFADSSKNSDTDSDSDRASRQLPRPARGRSHRALIVEVALLRQARHVGHRGLRTPRRRPLHHQERLPAASPLAQERKSIHEGSTENRDLTPIQTKQRIVCTGARALQLARRDLAHDQRIDRSDEPACIVGHEQGDLIIAERRQ